MKQELFGREEELDEKRTKQLLFALLEHLNLKAVANLKDVGLESGKLVLSHFSFEEKPHD